MKSKTFGYLLVIYSMLCSLGTGFPFSYGHIYSQTQFQTAIGGTWNEIANSIIQTSDGGYALAGFTSSFGGGSDDMYIVKLDASGLLQWSKTIGGTGADYSHSIIQTTDGGYILAGYTTSFGAGNSDMYIVKLDGSGSLQWSKTIGGTGVDVAYSIIRTTDGGYALTGSTTSFGAGSFDMYIVKVDASGLLQWSKTIGGTGSDIAYSIIQTTDGGYALTGSTTSFGAGNNDIYIIKLDAFGLLQWSKTIGGTSIDVAYSIIQTSDSGYALTGYYGSWASIYIAKFNASGSLVWSITIGGINDDDARSIFQTADGGYAVAGDSYDYPGRVPMYFVKLDASGYLQWEKTIGGTGDQHSRAIIQTTDGGYALAGQTNCFGAGHWDMFIVKFDANGVTCGNSLSPGGIFNTPSPTVTKPISTVGSPTQSIMTPVPDISSGGSATNICSFVGIENQNEIPGEFKLYQNYPNPFNPSTKISFSIPSVGNAREHSVQINIYDAIGREVETLLNEQLQPGTYEMKWDASNYPSGIYFCKISASHFTETRKMILLK